MEPKKHIIMLAVKFSFVIQNEHWLETQGMVRQGAPPPNNYIQLWLLLEVISKIALRHSALPEYGEAPPTPRGLCFSFSGCYSFLNLVYIFYPLKYFCRYLEIWIL